MTSHSALLQQLHDIHVPKAIGFWPLPMGWYAVFGLLLMIFVGILVGGWRWYHRGKVKREALRLLLAYEKTYRKNKDAHITSAAINELLKRVALVYFPRNQVASLQGKNWLIFLNETSKKLDFFSEETSLLLCPYQKNPIQDLQPLFQLAREWIAQRRKPCLR